MISIPFNKTKIIATVGPSSSSKEKLKELVLAGTDVFRLNFSHGTHEDHLKVLQFIRELNDELNINVCILQDLQGPKIRLSDVKKGAVIKAGDEFTLSIEDFVGDGTRASTTYKNIVNDVRKGDIILMDDGKLELVVKSTNATEVITEVRHGGPLKPRKGINLPYSKVSIPSLTEKDRADLEFGLKHDIEWIALSFVRNVDDIHELRKLINDSGKDSRIIAKIEKPEAVKNIDSIIEASDAIMVARGDLGVEILLEEVPMVQKQIVYKCKKAAKPVIIATQMMESMIEN
ncbi:MAG: pyruvate kinase, partial [Cyclobacteriaceae bacterium]|nr:pyruvate kinase [Cyclobacteriaceae bacterium]